MTNVRPILGRELLLDNDIRGDLRRKADPLIARALNTRGYTEEQSPVRRIYLNNGSIDPSNEYLSVFSRIGFDALTVATTFYVTQKERILTRSALNLYAVGGFAHARILGVGDTYKIDVKTASGADDASFSNVDPSLVTEILQDIRAQTPLGYSQSDEPVPPRQVIQELSALHPGQSIDRSAHFEMISDDPHYGKIKMNVGESFEIARTKTGNRQQERRLNTKKVFELTSVCPLEDGSVTLGTYYASGRKQSELQITAEIQGTNYSDLEKQVLYDRLVYDYQHDDQKKFGMGVIRNLVKIIDHDSDILRLG